MFYTRYYGKPDALPWPNRRLRKLEGAERGFVVLPQACRRSPPSILALVKSGDHIVAQRDVYGGATKFLTQWPPQDGCGDHVGSTLPTTKQHAGAGDSRPNTKLMHLESPTNPYAKGCRSEESLLAGQANANVITLIDSTFSNAHQLPVPI